MRHQPRPFHPANPARSLCIVDGKPYGVELYCARGMRRSRKGRRVRRSACVVYVCGEVLGEVVGAREALAARLAVVGPLARVDAQVPRQVALTAERAPAEQAHERTLARVLPHVQLQVLFRPHAFSTEWASEPPLPVPLPVISLHETQDP